MQAAVANDAVIHPKRLAGVGQLRVRDLELIERTPIFTGLRSEVAVRLLQGASVQRHPRGTILFEEGGLPDHLHGVLSGTVELYTSHGSRECGILLLSAHDFFMPAATLFEEPYLNSARTMTTSRILRLRADVVREEFKRSHAFTRRMSRLLAGHFRMATRHVIDLKCRGAPQRLAAFLLRLIDDSKVPGSVELPVPKRTLAARIGMTAETLSRTFQTLADNGLLVRGNRAILRDRAKIEAFCGAPPYENVNEQALGVHAF